MSTCPGPHHSSSTTIAEPVKCYDTTVLDCPCPPMSPSEIQEIGAGACPSKARMFDNLQHHSRRMPMSKICKEPQVSIQIVWDQAKLANSLEGASKLTSSTHKLPKLELGFNPFNEDSIKMSSAPPAERPVLPLIIGPDILAKIYLKVSQPSQHLPTNSC